MRADDGQMSDYEAKRRDDLAERLGTDPPQLTSATSGGPSSEVHPQPARAEATPAARAADYQAARAAELQQASGPTPGAHGVIAALTAPVSTPPKTNGNGNGHNGNGNGQSQRTQATNGHGANGNGNGRGFNGRYGYWANGNGNGNGGQHRAGPNPYLAFGRRQWRAMVAVMLIGGIITTIMAQQAPKAYQSSAAVLVTPPTDRAGKANIVRTASDYLPQVTTPYMLQLVSRRLEEEGITAPQRELSQMQQSKAIFVTAPGRSNLLTIQVTDSDAHRARTIADTFARSFVEDTNNTATSRTTGRATALAAQLEFASQELRTAELYDREGSLAKDLRTDGAAFLTLQLAYQAELQRQAEAESLAAGGPLTPDGTRRLSEINTASAATQAETLKIVRAQQEAARTEIARLTEQQSGVRAQSAALTEALGPEAAAVQDLRAREQDLLRTLDDQRARLLRLPTGNDQALGQTGPRGSTSASAPGVIAGPASETLAAVRGQVLELIQNQTLDSEQTIADLTKQREDIRAELARLPGGTTAATGTTTGTSSSSSSYTYTYFAPQVLPPAGAIQQQSLRPLTVQQPSQQQAQQPRTQGTQPTRATELQARDTELSKSLQAEQSRLYQLRTSYIAELERQSAGERATAGAQPAQALGRTGEPLSASDALALAQSATTQILRDQRQELAQSTALLAQRLEDVRAGLASMGFEPEPQATTGTGGVDKQLRDLQLRDQEVAKSLQAQQDRLYLLQTAEARDAAAVRTVASTPGSSQQPRAGAASTGGPAGRGALAPEVTAATAGGRAFWLESTIENQEQLQRNMNRLASELDDTRAALDAMPAKPDRALAAAKATAYRQQLSDLTREYADTQMDARAILTPLQRMGVASEPTAAASATKFLAMGGAGTVALALVIAGLLDVLMGWRKRRAAAATPAPASRSAVAAGV